MAVPASVAVTLHGGDGRQLEQRFRIVPAFEVLQLDDLSGASTVRLTAQVGVDALARNGTGDVLSTPLPAESSALPPRCTEPASIHAAEQPAEGWIVVTKDGLPLFAPALTPQQVAALRCDASVLFLEQNAAANP